MRFGLISSLSALVLGLSIFVGCGRDAAEPHPVSLHAANAAEAAEVAEQAAKVALKVAAHTEEVAHDTASALRYTQDALKRAGANAEDVAKVGKEADKLEEEAGGKGSASRRGESTSANGEEAEKAEKSSRKSSNLDSEEKGSSITRKSADADRETSAGSASGSASGSDGGNGEGNGGGNGEGGSTRGLDVNNEIVPYPSGVEPFGQEEPAKQLTKESVKQSDGMVNQIENAQGTEAKRSVYRALTKLRGATIASYDGMAKGHLKNVDNYNAKHKWRDLHPMKHLAQEEDDTHIWAFPKKGSKKSKAPKKKAAASPAPAAASPASAK